MYAFDDVDNSGRPLRARPFYNKYLFNPGGFVD